MNNSKNSYLPFLLLFIQPIFMASNLIVARGGVEYVPPISLAFWRWTAVFLILLPFTYSSLKKNFKFVKQEYKRIFFIGSMGCGVCGAFPFLAGQTTTVTNMGIIYSSSPIFIIIISSLFFKEKMNVKFFPVKSDLERYYCSNEFTKRSINMQKMEKVKIKQSINFPND